MTTPPPPPPPLILSLLHHQPPQPLHHLLRADPGGRDRLELPRHGFVGLRDQPVHGEVPARKGDVSGPEGERRAEVVGSVPHVEDPLVRTPPLLRPPAHVVPDDRLLAHVVRAPQAVVGVEGPHHQTAVLVEGRRVGENPVEDLADAVAPEPSLDEEGVGVGHQHDLEVLPGAEELEEGEHAGGGGELLHDVADVALGDAVLRQVGQDALHVLVVAAGLVGVLQPAGQVLARRGLHHHVVAGLVHHGLVKVKEDEEALVVGDVRRLRGHDLRASGPLGLPLAWGMGGNITTIEEQIPHYSLRHTSRWPSDVRG